MAWWDNNSGPGIGVYTPPASATPPKQNSSNWFGKVFNAGKSVVGGAAQGVGHIFSNTVHDIKTEGLGTALKNDVVNPVAGFANNVFVQPALRGGAVLERTQYNLEHGRPFLDGVNLKQFAGDTINTGLNFATLGEGTAAKEAIMQGGKQLFKGAAKDAALGAGYGVGNTLQDKDPTLKKLGENIAGGALIGGAARVGLNAAGASINKSLESALTHFENITTAAKLNHLSELPKDTLALPAGQPVEKQLGIEASSSANPVKTTPGGGAFGLHPDNPELVKRIQTQQKLMDAYTHPTADFQPMQNYNNQMLNGVSALDQMGKMRADELRSQQKAMGGVSLIKNEDGEVTGRASSNDQFYSKFYKTNGKPPTKADYLVEAHRQLSVGKDEEAQVYQATRQQLEEVHKDFASKYGDTAPVGDIQGPKVSADQADAAAGQKAGLEQQLGTQRLEGEKPQPFVPAPDKQISLNTLMQTYAKRAEHGTNTPGQVSLLNDIIQHPEASNELKQLMMKERESVLAKDKPNAEQAKTSVNETTQKPAPKKANVNPTETTSTPTSTKAPTAPEGEVVKAGTAKSSVFEKVFDKVTGGRGSGIVNPSRAASREGSVGLARAASDNVAQKRVRTFQAKSITKQFNQLLKGVDKEEVNKVIEGGSTKDAKVQAAADFFKQHSTSIGKEAADSGAIKGEKENYLPHVAKGLGTRGSQASGLKKNTRFNIERQSIEQLDEHGRTIKEDKYKTLDEFDAAIKKMGGAAERDPSKLLEHLLTTEGHAVENAKTVELLSRTEMADGRRALVTSMAEKNLRNPELKDYKVVDNKLIHPRAVNVYEAISKTGRIDNPFGALLAKSNSLGKRLVTLNGLFHALNIWKSSYAAQGVARSLWSIVAPGRKESDVVRALGYGLKLARASQDNIFDEVGKQTGLTGKINTILSPIDHALFHNFGDRQGLGTYFYIEKKMIKSGLSTDEAGRVAAEIGNQVMHFVPEDQQSMISRQAGQLFLFANQFLQNTLKTGTNALGVGLDRTLSDKGQRAQQKLAIARVARMFAYSFAAAQVINQASTGRFTWENGNGDPLNPIWYVKKGENGKPDKEYRITNHYGQLKDIAGFVTHPIGEVENKLAPGAREVISQISNHDLFTGDTIVNKGDNPLASATERLVHAVTHIITPAGVELKTDANGNPTISNGQPLKVQVARQLGINSSSTKPNDKTDYTKLAADKKGAQQLIDTYTNDGGSKLAAMQAAKASGNGYFDKFFSQHPELDPTSKDFNGKLANNNTKDVLAGAQSAKDLGGSKLQYMQDQKLGGSTAYDKFFSQNPNLDPTNDQFQGFKKSGGGSSSGSSAKKEATYQNNKVKAAAAQSASRARSKIKGVANNKPSTKAAKVSVPKIKVSKGATAHAPKVHIPGLKTSGVTARSKSKSSHSLKKLFT